MDDTALLAAIRALLPDAGPTELHLRVLSALEVPYRDDLRRIRGLDDPEASAAVDDLAERIGLNHPAIVDLRTWIAFRGRFDPG